MNPDQSIPEQEIQHLTDEDYLELSAVRLHLFGSLPQGYVEDPDDPAGQAD